MRQAVGVAVFFGMLGVTMFGLVFTPIFYVIVRNLADRSSRREKPAAASDIDRVPGRLPILLAYGK